MVQYSPISSAFMLFSVGQCTFSVGNIPVFYHVKN